MDTIIFIPGHVPSSKNSKVWTGKFLVNSKQTGGYIKSTALFWNRHRSTFKKATQGLQKPYLVGFHFVRNTKMKYDWVNPLQTVQDLMVKYQWLDDDNTAEILPFPHCQEGKWSTVDGKNPGVYITVNLLANNLKKLL